MQQNLNQKTQLYLKYILMLIGVISMVIGAKGQGKFSVELSGGLAKSFVQSEIIPNDPYFQI